MENIITILSNCRKKGIRIYADASATNVILRGNVNELSAAERQLISDNKKSILQFLMNARNGHQPIELLPEQADYALSSAQQRLWMVSRRKEASLAYHVQGAYVFKGDVDVTALNYAFDELVKRHEILRTIFRETADGDVRQRVLPPPVEGFKLLYEDVQHFSDKENYVRGRVAENFSLPFDLTSDMPVRAAIYQVQKDEWIFCCTMHHIVSDGWSLDLLTRELLALYHSGKTGAGNPLPPLRVQYKEYAAWQQQQLKDVTFDSDREYWLNRFSGELTSLTLPTDRPHPAVRSHRGATMRRTLSREDTDAFVKLCRQENCTLFVGLLSVVNMLLHKYTGQSDITIGSPIAGRRHVDLQDQIGFYVNTLALRNRFYATDNFRQLMGLVKDTVMGADEHQDYPFDRLVEELSLKRDMSRNPLFDVWVVVHDRRLPVDEAQGFSVSEYNSVDSGISRFDLLFAFLPVDEGIQMEIQYNSDIFEEQTISDMVVRLSRAIISVTVDPEKELSQLDLLSRAERHELLYDLGAGGASASGDGTILQLFEQQAEMSPHAIAVVAEEGQLTYAELNGRANQLADYLRKKYQVTPGDPVAIMLNRNVNLFIALFGVMKSGAAYLPIDPADPQERIAYMLEDSRCKLVVDDQLLENLEKESETYTRENLQPVNKPGDLAYVIYTSGSTGRPKGVMIEHRALLDYHKGILAETNIRHCKTFGLFSTIAADLGNTVIYTSLLLGGTLVLFPVTGIMEAAGGIYQTVDCIKIVPSHWKALQTKKNAFLPKKCLLFGGERLTWDVINAIPGDRRELQVFNHYGPTETTIGKLIHHVQVTDSSRTVPLGKPFGNNWVYLLDQHRHLVPRGLVGEICIGGEGVARGYLHQQQLTSERFVPDPFRENERIYLTGDLGRWLPDGTLEFIGRKDTQLKINGYRIEPGEIEHILIQQPGVGAALVAARENKEGHLMLVAYVKHNEGEGLCPHPDVPKLQEAVSRLLPAYMCPAFFVILNEFPLTANGKIDRHALPAPDETDDRNGIIADTPASEIERKLVNIWSEVLQTGMENIGINSDFFQLGGHSLRAIKVMVRIHDTFNVRIDPDVFFAEPTIAALAAEIENLLWLKHSADNGKDIGGGQLLTPVTV
ncbi:hypothetical protein A3860_05100 [Niastella vici]|uniref:Carrier domain-containing protein n=1 Tax=Niastella vici TaxID=1703345 RepID=A0A1V9FS01_9BACT|nr:non-ribosomal peptide synthetase [Niastella vici]OQP61098.1 hypothetical protein A3860_05100 [Niastella vici]